MSLSIQNTQNIQNIKFNKQEFKRLKSKIRCGIIYEHNDKFLFVFQKESKYWGLPKGRIKDRDLNPELIKRKICEKCAMRELYEETRIRLKSIKSCKEFKVDNHSYFLFISKNENRPECIPDNKEIIKYKWFTLDELCKLQLEKGSMSTITFRLINQLKDMKL
jgi:8-oxo-dGTP pyrophosphatase MutT (NUDIX family)